jgi:hypothetical protein
MFHVVLTNFVVSYAQDSLNHKQYRSFDFIIILDYLPTLSVLHSSNREAHYLSE